MTGSQARLSQNHDLSTEDLEVRRKRRPRQYDRHVRIREQVPETLAGLLRIDGHVRGAGAQDSDDTHDHFDRAVHGNRHASLPRRSERAQVGGHYVSRGEKPAVGEVSILEADRDGGRGGLGHLLDLLGNASKPLGLRVGSGVRIPANQDLLHLSGRGQLDLAQRHVRPFHESQKNAAELRGHPLDRGRVETIVIEDESHEQTVGWKHEQRQWKVASLQVVLIGDPKASRRRVALVQRHVLHHEKALEQRRAAYVAPSLYIDQGRVLVFRCIELASLEPVQPLYGRNPEVDGRAHRHRIDEEADASLDPRKLRRPAGNRRTEDHVRGLAGSSEHVSPGSTQHGVEGQAMSLRERPKRRGFVRREPHLALGIAS